MKFSKLFFIITVVILFMSSATYVIAGDFSWMENLNREANVNPDKFKARLADRFKIGSSEIEAVINDIKNPADAYMIFRYGEMTAKSPQYVMDRYKTDKKKGWGAFADSLGIKPGSKEFKALKTGHDLDGYQMGESKKNSKGKSKNKTKKSVKEKKKN